MPAAPFLASAALALHAMLAPAAPSASLTPRTELAKPDGPLYARLAADGACRLVLLDADHHMKIAARASAVRGDFGWRRLALAANAEYLAILDACGDLD